jgi:3D (Asp-Asp-Asp) domain-containing protein
VPEYFPLARHPFIGFLAVCLFVGGCASRPLPKYQKPIARAQIQRVRTTAYTHTESDHVAYGNRTALGTHLRASGIKSAAADWSRWPAGTLFQIQETGELYEVDDYGWALSGTNTIDLYKPSRAAMNAWGVRRVTIQNLRWGNPYRSLAILKSRSKHRHVKRMVKEYRSFGTKFPMLAQVEPVAPVLTAPAAPNRPRAIPVETRRAVAVQSDGRASALTPFR